MKAVLCGIGKIGRGVIAKSVRNAGYSLTMLDVNRDLVEILRNAGEYSVRSLDDDTDYTEKVSGYRVKLLDSREAEQAFCEADILFTSVGVNNLGPLMKTVAPYLLKRISMNRPPVDMIFCENYIGVGRCITGILKNGLGISPRLFEGKVGFVGGSVGVVVPPPQDPLYLVKGPYEDIHIEKNAMITDIRIPHFIPTNQFELCIREKLYIYNMAHAMASYLGWRLGYEYVDEAFLAPEIVQDVRAAMDATARALAIEYQAGYREMHEKALDIERRICNKKIRDTVVRIAEDPVRKLSHDDRLAGAYMLTQKHGIPCESILKGIAAGFRFREPMDSAAEHIALFINAHGIWKAVQRFTGLKNKDWIDKIVDYYNVFKTEDQKLRSKVNADEYA